MNLFQYETFFGNHFDPEVRSRGTWLIELIDKLQAVLLANPDLTNLPITKGLKRMQEIKLMAILHALDRNNGDRESGARWLGVCKTTIYEGLAEWNKKETPLYETEIANGHTIAPNINGLPNDASSSTTRKRTELAHHAARLPRGSS